MDAPARRASDEELITEHPIDQKVNLKIQRDDRDRLLEQNGMAARR